MNFPIISDDAFDVNDVLTASAIARLQGMYGTAQTQGDIDYQIIRVLKTEIKRAIEGVTNIPPEHIIIEL
jgi:hypothetical protein